MDVPTGVLALPADEARTLVRRAKRVLDTNWAERWTRPAPHFYPHQWAWDSAFIAIGRARYDQDRAETELRHLLEAQWSNGLVPQIVFDPKAGDAYFPGAATWGTDDLPLVPKGVRTSGIVQPPVQATAAWHIHRFSRDKTQALDFLEWAYPRLVRWHDYLRRDRDPSGSGLVYIRHPWESGQDNSPIWDDVMARAHVPRDVYERLETRQTRYIGGRQRPDVEHYAFFLHLIDVFRVAGYDEGRIRDTCPFLVDDVLFNTLLVRGERDLADIARFLGHDPAPHEAHAERTRHAMTRHLWDEGRGIFLDRDRRTRTLIPAETASGFTPLYGGIPTARMAARMVAELDSPRFCKVDEHTWAVPSYDRKGRSFNASKYWRGPVWLNINWMLCHGLEMYGYHDYAQYIKRSVVKLPQAYGFHEYFDPETGQGLGTADFSWTAALVLELLVQAAPDTRDLPAHTDSGP